MPNQAAPRTPASPTPLRGNPKAATPTPKVKPKASGPKKANVHKSGLTRAVWAQQDHLVPWGNPERKPLQSPNAPKGTGQVRGFDDPF